MSETNNDGFLPMSLEDLEITPPRFYHQKISPLQANLQSFSPEGLPHLKRLLLCRWQNLESVQLHSCTSLKYAQIIGCPHLGALDGLQHLRSLRVLVIEMKSELLAAWDLKLWEQEQSGNQVELFPLSVVELKMENPEGSVHSNFMCLPSIKKLELRDSPELVSVQLGFCTALEDLEIVRCKSLASIEGLQSIRNLRSLKVFHSPSLPPYLEQQGASAIWSRLENIRNTDVAMLSTPLCKQLTSLRTLKLWDALGCNGEAMVSLTEEQERSLQLLISLRQLSFLSCHLLESLPMNLRNLDSLEKL